MRTKLEIEKPNVLGPYDTYDASRAYRFSPSFLYSGLYPLTRHMRHGGAGCLNYDAKTMIWRAFLVRSPDALLTTTELVRLVYPRIRDPFRNGHWYAVRRAAVSVAKPVGRSARGKGRPLLWRAK